MKWLFSIIDGVMVFTHSLGEDMATNELSTIVASRGDLQFGRVIDLDIYNYSTGQKVNIPNDFNISFDFFKTTDETEQASTGVVTIMNLTDETYKKISTKHKCQMVLRAGYQSNYNTIFFADCVSIRKETQGNNVATIINVSANFFEYRTGEAISITQKSEYSVFGLLESIMVALTARNYQADTSTGKTYTHKKVYSKIANVSKEDTLAIYTYLLKARIGSKFSYCGNLDNLLKQVSETYGLRIMSSGEKNNVLYTISIKDEWLGIYLDRIKSNYQEVSNDSGDLNIETNVNSSLADDTLFFLNYQTGLLGTPHIDYKVFTVPENYKGLDSDETTLKSQITILNKNAKQAEKDKKAKEKGKPIKARKLGTKRVKKTFLSAKALLNPNIRPQSAIQIDCEDEDISGIYRVRNITYKGDNQSGDFLVELYLEDTSDSMTVVATDSDIKNFGSDEQIFGGLGANQNNDSDDSGGADSVSTVTAEPIEG